MDYLTTFIVITMRARPSYSAYYAEAGGTEVVDQSQRLAVAFGLETIVQFAGSYGFFDDAIYTSAQSVTRESHRWDPVNWGSSMTSLQSHHKWSTECTSRLGMMTSPLWPRIRWLSQTGHVYTASMMLA